MIHMKLTAESAMTYDAPFIDGIYPYEHQAVQLELIEQAFTNRKSTIVWNTALTGAGKTLANYSYLLRNPKVKSLGIYPVNELIKDQYQSLQSLPLQKWEEIAVWTAEKLRDNQLPKETRLETILRLSTRYYRTVLTNPDYLMLLSQERLYSYLPGPKAEAFNRFSEYQLQIFDEFHLYDISQVNFLVQWMGLMITTFPEKTFVFVLSSATPRPEIMQLLESLHIDIRSVAEHIQDWKSKYRAVEQRTFLQPVKITLLPCSLQKWYTSEKIIENWNHVEEYLLEWPKAKGLIILDSIYEAQWLANELRKKGYEVGEVHGLSNRRQSREALAKPITVATATVEVGVDFQKDIRKDFMVCEARNPGSFMQRIGRIGRGSRSIQSPPLRIWTYLPKYVVEQIKSNDSDELSRVALQHRIQHAFRESQNFLPYIHKVGGMNLVHSFHQLRNYYLDKKHNPVLENMKNMIESIYSFGFHEQKLRYGEWRKKGLLEPVISFRGQNTLEKHLFKKDDLEHEETFYPDIWFWDETLPDLPLMRYHYGFVLRRRQVDFVSKEEIIKRVDHHFNESNPLKVELMRELEMPVMGYAIVKKHLTEPVSFHWKLPVSANRKLEKIVRLDRLRLRSSDVLLDEQLHAVFHDLRFKSWIVYIIPRPVNEVTDLLHLPPMFRLYRAKSATGANWSIAFNIEAFQLWSIWENFRSEVL
ncbi:type I-D CRISPR-associated helicase Cas3' [Hazenella sp. IB182353]|uniref:type I-D CRISPR-associated helicase Cas3' n=1 Tax=Polycladospora coralii TaxID=2771432 RepID=UPI0017469175|nr:type I-D CRISPR-associated helicase Cas3' [Polycladospora coralii]MBS7531170.1 type I-D CRISPR-associated helicase Cas3' [Polycladospora coralii]